MFQVARCDVFYPAFLSEGGCWLLEEPNGTIWDNSLWAEAGFWWRIQEERGTLAPCERDRDINRKVISSVSLPNGKEHPKQKFDRGEKCKEEISHCCCKEPSSSRLLTSKTLSFSSAFWSEVLGSKKHQELAAIAPKHRRMSFLALGTRSYPSWPSFPFLLIQWECSGKRHYSAPFRCK